MSKTLPLLLLLLLSSAFAQTPAYTTSDSFGCNANTCNGVPLNQGGTWQFIELNRTFSMDNVDSQGNVILMIYGNPGNPGSGGPNNVGGMSNIVDKVPQPPNLYQNGSVGVQGTITFDFAAVNGDRSLTYLGHVVVQGHRVRHFVRSPRGSGSYYSQLVVDDAQIFIDSVN